MNEIKSCPFCNFDMNTVSKVSWFIREPRQINPENIQVQCLGCGARGGAAWNEREAIEKWNRRAKP